MYCLVSMATSVATVIKVHVIVVTGIEGVCYHYLICKAGQWGCFTLSIFRQSLFINTQLKCH